MKIKIMPARRTDSKDLFRLQREFDSCLQSLTEKKRENHTERREKPFVRYGLGRERMFLYLGSQEREYC